MPTRFIPHVIPVVATPTLYNAMQDATRDFIAVTIHGSLSHSLLGTTATIVTVAIVYCIVRIFHVEER
jgi:hypothetical protein